MFLRYNRLASVNLSSTKASLSRRIPLPSLLLFLFGVSSMINYSQMILAWKQMLSRRNQSWWKTLLPRNFKWFLLLRNKRFPKNLDDVYRCLPILLRYVLYQTLRTVVFDEFLPIAWWKMQINMYFKRCWILIKAPINFHDQVGQLSCDSFAILLMCAFPNKSGRFAPRFCPVSFDAFSLSAFLLFYLYFLFYLFHLHCDYKKK